MQKSLFKTALAISLLTALGISGCNNDTKTQSQPQSQQTAESSKYNAEPYPRKIQANSNGTHTISIDFGMVAQGTHQAPLRGLLITPKTTDAPTPLLVLSHLRAPNCMDKTFAYPCADGVAEFRYDEGMAYLGEALAEKGYTVIIPDLAGVFIGADVNQPYSQTAMWSQVVGRFVEALKADLAKDAPKDVAARIFGVHLAPIDFSKVGLFAHSRSGQMTDAAIALFGKDNLRSVLAYAPAYDTIDLQYISAKPADVPYLALTGSGDADVGASANLWLSHYANDAGKFAKSAVEVPRLGHMYINRAASAAQFDDRIGCDMLECPDASEHERVLIALATQWFDATLQGTPSDLPLQATQALPEKIADLPARWLALTNNAIAHLSATDFHGANGKTVTQCIYVDPMDPRRPANACDEPKSGIMQILTPIAQLSDAVATTAIKGAQGIALQVAPIGDVNKAGTTLKVQLTMDDGSTHSISIPNTYPALINRRNDIENGTYRLGTMRFMLPEEIAGKTIVQVALTSDYPLALRSVDFF